MYLCKRLNYICQIIVLWFLFPLFYWTVSNLKVRLKKEKIISGEAIEDRDRKASNLCLMVHQMNWHLLIYLVFKCKISTQCFCINSKQNQSNLYIRSLIGAKKIDTSIIKPIMVCVHGSLHMHINAFININFATTEV